MTPSDGLLETGSSRARATAYIGGALVPFVDRPEVAHVERAGGAILRIGCSNSWRCNLVTACDADSTGRLLHASGRHGGPAAEAPPR